MAIRSENELRQARRALFEAFPRNPTAEDAVRFQKLLAHEILTTEGEQRVEREPIRRNHLRAVRLYGDAIAYTLLSRYAIRQLSRNTGKPPHLTGQGDAFQLVLDCACAIAERGVPPLLADLTNVVKNSDLLGCVDPDLPIIIECKLSKVKEATFERQGRRGRQLARFESIGEFLRNGRGRIFGEDTERCTIEVTHIPRFSYDVVDEIVASALKHRPVAVTPSPDELYAAALCGEIADTASAIARLRGEPGEQIALASSLDPLRSGTWDVPPPILWAIGPAARWALMEGDVAISHTMRVQALVGTSRNNLRVNSVVALPGRVPWGYEILVGHESLTMSANIVLDVVYCHETIESAGEKLLEQTEKAVTLLRELSNVGVAADGQLPSFGRSDGRR